MKTKDMKFALFGHGYHICYLIEKIISEGFPKPVVITHPKKMHERDRRLLTDPNIYRYLFDVAKKNDVVTLETDKVNCENVYSFLKKHNCNVAFASNCRSIFNNDLIEFFSGKMFNIHPTILPNEKGSGIFSWRILNNSNEISGTIHYIDSGVDTGNIVLQKKEMIDKEFPTPHDFLIKTGILFNDLIDQFFNDFDEIILSNGTIQPQGKGSYRTRLITEDNGAIDWTLNGDLIERTIRAFSDPYPGAFTYLNGLKVQILSSKFEKVDHSFHPLMHGRIVDLSESGIAKVAVRGGYIFIDKVKKISGDFCNINDLINRPGQFHTPYLEVELARCKSTPISKLEHD